MISHTLVDYPRILKNTDKIIKKNNLLQVINLIHDISIISFFTDHSLTDNNSRPKANFRSNIKCQKIKFHTPIIQ